jgi:hypothetical protein
MAQGISSGDPGAGVVPRAVENGRPLIRIMPSRIQSNSDLKERKCKIQ